MRKSGAKDPTVVSNNAGVDGIGLGVLLETGLIGDHWQAITQGA